MSDSAIMRGRGSACPLTKEDHRIGWAMVNMTNRQFPLPSSAEIQECLLRFLFGYEASYLTASIRLAYADLRRTIRGIARHDPAGQMRQNATSMSLRFNSWSRLDSYREYMDFQHWVRQTFPSSAPLAVAFFLWQETAAAAARAI